MADDFILEYGDLIKDDGTFEKLTADIKKLEKELIDMAKNTQKAFANIKPDDIQGIQKLEKAVKEVEQGQKNLIKTEKQLQQVKKKTIDLTQEELVQREAIKLENRERVQRAKQLAIIAKEEKNSIASLRAQLSLATLEWKKFTAEEIKTTKEGQKAFNQKKQLTEQLKKLEKATGDHRREVGNYGIALNRLNKISGKVRKTLIGLFVGRNIISGIQRIGGAFKGLVDDFRDSNAVIGGVGESFDKITGALQFVGVKILEFLAPAIEYVANLLSKLPAFFAGIAAGASQFGTNVGATFKKLGLQIELVFAKINRNNPFSSQNADEIEANINRIEDAIQSQTDTQRGVAVAYKEAYDAVIKEQEEFTNRQAAADKAAADKKAREDAKRRKAELDAIKAAEQKKLEVRLQAIISLQAEIKKLEAENIKDGEERAVKLEELRFEAEKKVREAQFDELEAFFSKNAKKLRELQKLEDDKAAAQLVAHEQNLLDIKKQFALEVNDIEAIDVLEQTNSKEEELLNEKVQLVEDSNKKIEESNKELFENISQTAQKVGDLINETFQRQADLSQESVDKQAANLERARDRAAQGLEANLAFEEQELAKRQAEQQQKQKEAEQAARILALFNLVSAYAASGDQNALARGLVDWSLMTALSQGFEEGGFTGSDGSNSTVKGVVHANEYVVTAKDTARFGLVGKSGDEFGEAMSDYYTVQSPVTQNHYQTQREEFNKGVNKVTVENSQMVKELQAIKKEIANQPNYSAQIVQLQEDVYGFVLAQQKKGMKKIYKKVLRAKK